MKSPFLGSGRVDAEESCGSGHGGVRFVPLDDDRVIWSPPDSSLDTGEDGDGEEMVREGELPVVVLQVPSRLEEAGTPK